MAKKQVQEKNVLVPILIVTLILAVIFAVFYVSRMVSSSNTNDQVAVEKVNIAQEELNSLLSECTKKPSINQKDWCYLDIAKSTKKDVCGEIVQPSFRKYCQSIVTNDESFCKEITTPSLKDACYIYVAIETSNVKLCKNTINQKHCETLVV